MNVMRLLFIHTEHPTHLQKCLLRTSHTLLQSLVRGRLRVKPRVRPSSSKKRTPQIIYAAGLIKPGSFPDYRQWRMLTVCPSLPDYIPPHFLPPFWMCSSLRFIFLPYYVTISNSVPACQLYINGPYYVIYNLQYSIYCYSFEIYAHWYMQVTCSIALDCMDIIAICLCFLPGLDI